MRNLLLISALLPMLLSGQLPGADQIMSKSRELSMIGSMKAKLSLTITEKNGAVRSRIIELSSKSYPSGTEKRLIRFTEPADVRGTSMLVVDNNDTPDEIWIYLPALKKTRRIVTSEKGKSFMSTEFSNADMGSPALSDFRSSHLAGSGKDNNWIIESIPINDEKADEYGYSKKISYVSKETFIVQKMEFYNFENELFKKIEIQSVHNLPGGKYIINQMSATNLINQRKSEIKFRDIQTNVETEDSYFTLQMLER